MTDINAPFYVFIFIATFLLTVVIERLLIPRLKYFAKQPIYEDGPAWHLAKTGTPTMGGLAFLSAITLSLILGAVYLYFAGDERGATSLALILGYSLLNSLVGVLDDYRKLKKQENEGLTPTQKIILQAIIAAVFLYLRHSLLGNEESLFFSFGDIDLGWLYYPLTVIILLGITNCANLTDGVDGLASGVAFAIGVSLFYISCALSSEASIISVALMGATTAFLIFNIHPAKVFMGDTGSLLLGSLVASSGVCLGNPLVSLFVGGVYVIEGVSVILQVFFFKLLKKRIFKMSPLHHHLEKCGWSENRICIVAIIATFIMSLPAFIFYLP